MGKIGRITGRFLKAVQFALGYPDLTREEKSRLSRPVSYTGRNVLLDFGRNPFNRTLYTLVKYFSIEGYTVIVKPNRYFFSSLKNDLYGNWLIEDGVLTLSENPTEVDLTLSFRSKKGLTISDDYFSTLNIGSGYHIPMTQHPIYYKDGNWIETYEKDMRFQSVFIAGNFLERRYKRIDKEQTFQVINRVKLMNFLRNQPYTVTPATRAEFDESLVDGKLYMINTEVFSIPSIELRSVLSSFSFFLAAPGVSVPFSHNVIEAMSVGCIPVIEHSYAALFSPPLVHGQTALVFNNLDSLNTVISEAFRMGTGLVTQMRSQVENYYRAHLTPAAVVSKIAKEKPTEIYLLSYTSSSRLYKKYLGRIKNQSGSK